MKDLAFVLPLAPPRHTAQQTGLRAVIGEGGKPFVLHYKRAEIKRIERAYCEGLRPYAPTAPLVAPVAVAVAFYFAAPQCALPSMKRAGVALRRKATKPDCDNAAKLLLDCLTRCGFYADDAAVAALRIEKFETSQRPRIAVRVRELGTYPGELFEPKDEDEAEAAPQN